MTTRTITAAPRSARIDPRRALLPATLIALAFLWLGAGCTSVKFVLKNPYTAEVWTVYEHTLGADTIVYCPPVEGNQCTEASFSSGSTSTAPAASTNDE